MLHAWCWFGSVGIITPKRCFKQTAQRVRSRNNERVSTSSMASSHTLCTAAKNGRIIIARKELLHDSDALIRLCSTLILAQIIFAIYHGCEHVHILRLLEYIGQFVRKSQVVSISSPECKAYFMDLCFAQFMQNIVLCL